MDKKFKMLAKSNSFDKQAQLCLSKLLLKAKSVGKCLKVVTEHNE